MKKFIRRLLYFIFVFFLPLFIFEELLTYELNNGVRYNFQADWHDLKNHNAEVLFVGNSRTWVHVNPFEVQNKTGLSSEIIGHDGGDIALLWLKFKEYSRNNKTPKHLFLQLDPSIVQAKSDLYGINNFRTCFYFRRNIEMEDLNDRKGFHFYYKYFPLAALDIESFVKFCLRRKILNEDSYALNKGFKAQKKSWKGNWLVCPEEIIVEEISCYVDSFYIYCNNNSVELHSIFSPLSPSAYSKIKFLKRLKDYHDSLNKVLLSNYTFKDYNNNVLYNDSNLFYNHMHLNSNGVDVFMNQLLSDSSIKWMN